MWVLAPPLAVAWDATGRRVPPLIAGLSLGLGFVALPAGGAPSEPVASMPASLLVLAGPALAVVAGGGGYGALLAALAG